MNDETTRSSKIYFRNRTSKKEAITFLICSFSIRTLVTRELKISMDDNNKKKGKTEEDEPTGSTVYFELVPIVVVISQPNNIFYTV